MKKWPRTGEKRQVRQPLKIDKLSQALRDRIQAERAAGRTWEEIEAMSPSFDEWGTADAALFPGGILPHTTLARWWDLRVDQVRREVMKQAEAAKALAGAFAGRKFKGLPDAVMNALRDLIFSVLEQSDQQSKKQVIKALSDLGWLVSEMKKREAEQEKLDIEKRRVELSESEFAIRKKKFDQETNNAARKLDRGKPITTDDINRIRERTFGLPPVEPGAAASHPA